MPNVHLLEDHDLLKMVIENGLWNKDEEFIQWANQKGLKYKKITKHSMRDATSRYSYMSRWERARNTVDIRKYQAQTILSRKRKMGPKAESKSTKMKTEWDFNRATALHECAELDMENKLA